MSLFQPQCFARVYYRLSPGHVALNPGQADATCCCCTKSRISPIGLRGLVGGGMLGNTGWFNPFTLKSDQFQISPAASPVISHNTVWRTWLFIAYSDWKMNILHQFSLPTYTFVRMSFLSLGMKGVKLSKISNLFTWWSYGMLVKT